MHSKQFYVGKETKQSCVKENLVKGVVHKFVYPK